MTKINALNQKELLSLILTFISFIFLVPGIGLSMLTISSSGSVDVPLAHFGVQLFNTTNSILHTVINLYRQGYAFVAIMIFAFSVIIPVTKAGMLVHCILVATGAQKDRLFHWIKSMGKWSMCDVFIVAIFLSYLSTGSSTQGETHETSVLGIPIDIHVMINMDAKLEIGFYCFLTYCLLSLFAIQILDQKKPTN